MAAPVSTSSMIINLAIQVGQIAIFFAIFIYLYGSKVSRVVQERQVKEEKLANAELEYESMITQAQQEKEKIVSEALARKQSILSDAEELAQQKMDTVLSQAHRDAEQIKSQAERASSELQSELVAKFDSMVRNAAASGLKKLINEEPTLYQKYLDTLVKESA